MVLLSSIESSTRKGRQSSIMHGQKHTHRQCTHLINPCSAICESKLLNPSHATHNNTYRYSASLAVSLLLRTIITHGDGATVYNRTHSPWGPPHPRLGALAWIHAHVDVCTRSVHQEAQNSGLGLGPRCREADGNEWNRSDIVTPGLSFTTVHSFTKKNQI